MKNCRAAATGNHILEIDSKWKGNRVTFSDVMNFSDVFPESPPVRALPRSQNTLLRFLCQTQVPMFQKLVDQSILRSVDSGLEERINGPNQPPLLAASWIGLLASISFITAFMISLSLASASGVL